MTSLEKLLHTMEKLRDKEQGCPWDLKQTMDSLVPSTIEEAYEVADAIARKDWDDTRLELGDLLLQVVFYSQIAKEEQRFAFDDVAKAINDKLIRRHPHVFGNEHFDTVEEQLVSWEAIKKEERDDKGYQSILDDVPAVLPGLLRAEKLQKRCKNEGFDWDNIQDVEAKVAEELQEVSDELHASSAAFSQEKVEEEMGDLLFAVVNLARHAKVKPEMALDKANRKFERRFRGVEQALVFQGKSLHEASLEEMDALWDQIKEQEKKHANLA